MKLNNKVYIIGTVLVILVVIGAIFFSRRTVQKGSQGTSAPTEEVLPTVDSSVKVSLTGTNGNKELILKIDDIPDNTQSVDYELSYQTAQQGLQGVIGTSEVTGNSLEKKLTLGTCSSGTCVYHQVVGKIKLTLKFTGSYGEKLFEKEYTL